MSATDPAGVSSDLLSSASTLVGAVGVVFGLWRNEIDAAKRVRAEVMPEDRQPAVDQVEAAIRRARALTIAASLVVLIFAVPVFRLVTASARSWLNDPLEALRNYDVTGTAFVVVYGVGVVLAVASFQALRLLKSKLQRLTKA